MSVLYLTPGCFDKGGISRYARYQITALRETLGADRVRVYSVHGPRPGDFEDPFDVDHAAGGTRVDRKARFAATVTAAALLRRPAIIVAGHVNLSGLAHSLSRIVRARSVVNIYGLEVWSGMRSDAAWGLRRSDLAISDCHFTARYVSEHGLRPRLPIEVLWDCVDTRRFSPGAPSPRVLERYGIPDPATGVNVLTFGRMSSAASHKGYERLLEVFWWIASAAPMVRLVFAGRGDLADRLRHRVKGSALAPRVFFTGMVHDDDVTDLYRAAHVFSLVSDRGIRRGEGIPLTPLEAAACGVPLLVGNHDGSQEAVLDGENGYVVDPFDLDTHAARIVTLANDEALRRRMGSAARARVVRHHDYLVFRATQARILASVGVARTQDVVPELSRRSR
jgi:phosphatidylinositol alpha-1,6-mannosyltransferase